MLAAVLTQFRAPLELRHIPDAVPHEGAVTLRVLACGVCRSDWHVWTGSDSTVSLPHVPGHEYCGEIIEVGQGVSRWQVGDHVIAPFILACGECADCAAGNQTICDRQELPGFTRRGAFAEFVTVPFADTNLTRLPESISPVHAAALGCRVTTAWNALNDRGGLQAGEWLAVIGAGGVGLACGILAQAMGARVVIADVSEAALKHARSLGFDAVVHSTEIDPEEAVLEITGGGADMAIEAVGLAATTITAMRVLKKRGRLVQIGMPAGKHSSMRLPWNELYSKQLAIYGTRGMPPWRMPSLLRLLETGRIDLSSLITRELKLSDVSGELAAFDQARSSGIAVIKDFTQ